MAWEPWAVCSGMFTCHTAVSCFVKISQHDYTHKFPIKLQCLRMGVVMLYLYWLSATLAASTLHGWSLRHVLGVGCILCRCRP